VDLKQVEVVDVKTAKEVKSRVRTRPQRKDSPGATD